MAEFFLQEGQCKEAVNLISTLNDYLLHQPETAFSIAAALALCKEDELAAELYGSILDKNFEHWKARKSLADIYIRQGEKNRAIALYDIYRRRHQDCGDCYAEIASIHHRFGNDETALRILDYVIKNPALFKDITSAQKTMNEIRQSQKE